MKKMLAMVVFAAMVCGTVFANDMDQWPEGVTAHKKDGVVVGFTCVGWAPFMGGQTKSVAAKTCSARAEVNARNAYSRYMSTQVQWKRNDKNEVVCIQKGSQGGDNADTNVSNTESSYSDCSQEESEQFTQACLSGLGAYIGGWNSDKNYVWVGKIDLAAIEALKGLARANNEIHAEVDDMGAAEKAKKAARDAKEIEAIKNAPNNAYGAKAAGEAGAATEAGRGAIDNRNMQTPSAGGKTPKVDFD